jgi:ATP-dependent DNA helicase RecG
VSEVGESPFQSAIAAALRPLAFAARDGFANFDRVRDLERTVSQAIERAAALAIPRDAQRELTRIATSFSTEAKGDLADRVRGAIEVLSALAEPSWSERQLDDSTAALPGVGPKRAEKLARRDLASVADLLFHLPVHYDDRRSLQSVGSLEVGSRATFVARVLGCAFSARRGRFGGRVFEALVGDDTGTVTLKWFRSGDSLAKQVRKDALLLITGDVKRYRFDKELAHPEISVLTDASSESANIGEVRSVAPEYATPEGIHPRGLRRAISAAVEWYSDLVPGHLPADLVAKLGLPEPGEALRELHQPALDVDADELAAGATPARTRLVLEELYLLELGLALRREQRAAEPGTPIAGGERSVAAACALPFELTGAQERALGEILADLQRAHPMNRLLEGDVGCGKTVVAYLAAAAVAESGYQSALMAPTELLAEQHEATLSALARAAGDAGGLRIARLTASIPGDEAARIRRALASGEIDLVVGTHALIQESVEFRALAFAVIDEQHRFGVAQRAALAGKAAHGNAPHTLVMTATPIPRTLALTLYGDLDISVIDELPPGRAKTKTDLLRAGQGQRVAELLRETTSRGEQVYVVYPLVAESEKIDLRAAVESADKIRAAFANLSVDLVHGQLDAAARNAAMARFASGETQVLVSTTVIEVGVDIPNATLMIVEHAERFGLAQLHQLRGRVGRGQAPGTCLLVARGSSEDSEARLRALLDTTDGFAIAEADLAIRGPGEFLGTRQHGHLPDLRIADLTRDVQQIAIAREAALKTVRGDPQLRANLELARAVQSRWGDRLSLIGVG